MRTSVHVLQLPFERACCRKQHERFFCNVTTIDPGIRGTVMLPPVPAHFAGTFAIYVEWLLIATEWQHLIENHRLDSVLTRTTSRQLAARCRVRYAGECVATRNMASPLCLLALQSYCDGAKNICLHAILESVSGRCHHEYKGPLGAPMPCRCESLRMAPDRA
ncbi:hypothetical protein MRX96_058096 [Rhipicephalus microplus]